MFVMDLTSLHLHWREAKRNDKTYRSYSLARAYRRDGKNRKEICVKLGKLSDDAANRWRTFLKAIKKEGSFVATLEDLSATGRFAYLDVAAVNAAWDAWRLDDAFNVAGLRDVKLSSIAKILTINRCIAPASKSQTAEWFKGTALSWMLDINSDSVNASRIFRELETIEKQKEAICSHLFKLIAKRYPDSLNSIFYDLSSTTFTGSRCLLMKWGHCKEGYRNHIVLAIVVNQDGLPFYWEVLPGGTADSTTIAWLMERMKHRFRVKGVTLVFDRGMVSDDNLVLLEGNGKEEEIKYISAMDKNQIEEISGLDFNQFAHLTSPRIDKQVESLKGFSKLNENTWYREVGLKGKRRYILCFNPQLFKDQNKAREEAEKSFQEIGRNLNAELLRAKKSRQEKTTLKKFKKEAARLKVTQFANVSLEEVYLKDETGKANIRTYRGSITFDDKKKKKAGELDGFWLLVTNHIEKSENDFTVSAKEAINPYREKVVIEAAFRDIKSFVEVAPVYVWTKEHVKAHYTLCVLSYLMDRTLTLRLHNKKGEITRDVVAHEKLYEKLSGCMIDQLKVANVGLSTFKMTPPTNEQRELLERIEMTKLLGGDIEKKARQAEL